MLAVVSGGSAAYFALAYLRESTPTLLAADKPSQKVAVAARDLPLGAEIHRQRVTAPLFASRMPARVQVSIVHVPGEFWIH